MLSVVDTHDLEQSAVITIASSKLDEVKSQTKITASSSTSTSKLVVGDLNKLGCLFFATRKLYLNDKQAGVSGY